MSYRLSLIGPMHSGIAGAEVHVRLAFNPRVTLFQLIKKGDPKSFMNKSKKRAHFKKERSSETVSTRLWEADDALFLKLLTVDTLIQQSFCGVPQWACDPFNLISMHRRVRVDKLREEARVRSTP